MGPGLSLGSRTRIVRELPDDAWRAFVLGHPEANVFHTPEMFEVFSRARGYRPELWAALDEADRVVALLLPVRIQLWDGLARFFTTRSVAFGSALVEHGDAGVDGMRSLLRAYAHDVDAAVLFTELRNVADLGRLQGAFEASGFAYEEHLNYLIPLGRPVEEILGTIRQRTRKQIRRGLRSGEVVVEDCVDRDRIDVCFELLRKSYATARVPVPDRSLFEAAFDVLHPRGMVKFLLAWVGDECAAASVELVFGDTIYGWYGGVDRAFASSTPNELLMWHILRWGAEHGYRVYDFGGAGKPDERYGVRDFKAKFGGELVNHGRNVRRHAPWRLAVSTAGYGLYRRLSNPRRRSG
jgi:serine/alanine adding enzyme